MPPAAKRFCLQPGCPNFGERRGRCAAHQVADRSERAKEWHSLYDSRWQRYRRQFLAEHPACVDPFDTHGPLVIATVVDHKVPHRGDRELFWDPGNHWALCKRDHDRKTAEQDGGFGNR